MNFEATKHSLLNDPKQRLQIATDLRERIEIVHTSGMCKSCFCVQN
jgi:hypothetical protein